MHHPQHIIFDLDGTLIHSAPDIHAAINVALTASGRTTLDLHTVTSFIGNGVETLVSRCLATTGGTDPATQTAVLTRFLQTYNAHPAILTRPYPGVIRCLDALIADGFALAICTNKPGDAAQKICDALDLTRYFKVITGASADLAKKPDPAMLVSVIRDMAGSPGTALYVGDSAIDQATAHNANVPFALFSGGYLNTPLSDRPPALTFDVWDRGCLFASDDYGKEG